MSEPKQQAHNRLTLKSAVLALMLACAGVAGVILASTYRSGLDTFSRETLETAVEARANGLQQTLARALHNEWRGVAVMAERIELDRALPDGVPADLQAHLQLMVGDGGKHAWAGVAALDGTVLAASNGMLVGQNVAARPWFQRGLEGDFAGDVHEAVLLASLLAPAAEEPPRFIDFATPVRDTAGDIAGVLGLHADWDWVRSLISETSQALDVDAFLISHEGEILMSSVEDATRQPDLASVRAAGQGAARTFVEDWPDGSRYYTTVVPSVAYRDLPSFGWSMVVRIDAALLYAPTRTLTRTLLIALLALPVMFLVLGALFNRIFARPFDRLAHDAEAIAEGQDAYPAEYRHTRELDRMSNALVRIQSTLTHARER